MEKICIVKRRQQYAQPEVKLPQPEKSEPISPEVAKSSITVENRFKFQEKISEKAPEKIPEKLPEKRNIEEIAGNIAPVSAPAGKSDIQDKKMMEEFVRSFAMESNPDFPQKEKAEKFLTVPSMVIQSESGNKKIVEEFVDNSSSVISIIMTKEQSVLLQQSEYIKELLNGTKSDPALDIKLSPDGRLSLNYRFNDSLLLRMLAPNQVCQMLQVSRSFLQKLVHENRIKSYKLGRMRRFLLEDILEYLSNDATESAPFSDGK